MLNSAFTVISIVVGTAKSVGEALKALSKHLMGLGLLGALIESFILAGVAGVTLTTVAEFIALAVFIASSIGLMLALADALYGNRGVDVYVSLNITQGVRILPPTIEKQTTAIAANFIDLEVKSVKSFLRATTTVNLRDPLPSSPRR
jgi:hypothetical protein